MRDTTARGRHHAHGGLRVWLALLAGVVLLHVARSIRSLRVDKATLVLVSDSAITDQDPNHLRHGTEPEPTRNQALEREWARVIRDGVERVPEPFASAASALRVHYTAKMQATEMETNWTAVNGQLIDIRFYNDDDSLGLVAQFRPHFLETYKTKLTPVERADYFRYLVLWVYGGLYIDSDTKFMLPVDQWLHTFGWDPRGDGWKLLATIDLVVGVEFPTPQPQYNETGWLPLQFSQFVIAGAKGSDVLKRIIDHVEHCVETVDRKGDVERTLQRTGPAAFTRAILNLISECAVVSDSVLKMHTISDSDERYPRALLPAPELEKHGQLLALSGGHRDEDATSESILVLPYRAFAYYPSHGFATAAVLSRHLFNDSWRPK